VNAYTHLLRPLLFQVPGDRAHAWAHTALSYAAPWALLGRALPAPDPRLAVDFCGLRLRTPVGLAAGFDKDCENVSALSRLGFGCVTVGSIMSEVRPGNPLPRLSRLPRRQALLNSQGLPSKGRAAALARLRALPERPVPLVANLCGFAVDELAEATRDVQPYVDAVEIGLICPQTGDQGGLGTLQTFAALVEALVAVRRVPLLIKLPPHHTPDEYALVREMVRLCSEGGVDGLTVGGGYPIPTKRLATGRGSLSGRPIFPITVRLVEEVAAWSAGRLPIKAGGGAFSGADVLRLLRAGASVVEIYTAFVYRGPTMMAALNRELLEALDRAGIATAAAARPEARTAPTAATVPVGVR
jgi:dihydroorotate dehydrogenase (fumarate)/dihydroorotate dehydrogenase